MSESYHIWMSHVTYEWVISHMNESCHIWVSHIRVISEWNDDICSIRFAFISSEWDIRSILRHVSFVCVRHDSFLTWLINMWYDSLISSECDIWSLHSERSMSNVDESCHIWMSHVTYKWVTYKWVTYKWVTYKWLIRMCYTRHSFHIWNLHFAYKWVMSRLNKSRHIWMSSVTARMNEACQM